MNCIEGVSFQRKKKGRTAVNISAFVLTLDSKFQTEFSYNTNLDLIAWYVPQANFSCKSKFYSNCLS